MEDQVSKLIRRLFKTLISAIAFVITVILSFSVISYFYSPTIAADENVTETKLSKSEIEELIEQPNPAERDKGVKALLNAADSDTTWALKTILAGITIEETYLANSKEYYFRDVYTSYYNLQKYVQDLGVLGSASTELIQNLADSLSPDQKPWANIALGYNRVPSVHEKLRDLIIKGPTPLHKAMAAEAIAAYDEEADVTILYNAFREEGNSIDWRMVGSDISGFDPVAMAAQKSLEQLGYKIDVNSWNLDLIKLKP